MSLIECKAGAAETTVGGETYAFERDEYDRFVCQVHNLLHRSVLLSVEHYREVPDVPPPADDAEIPAFLGLPASDGTDNGPSADSEVNGDANAKPARKTKA